MGSSIRSVALARLLVGVIVGVVTSFLAVSCVARERARAIDVDVQAIVDDAMPSVRILDAARGALRRLDADVARCLELGVSCAGAVRRDDAVLAEELRRYDALPASASEPPLKREVNADVAALDRTLDDVVGAVDHGRVSAVIAEERARSARADDALERLVDLNAVDGAQLGAAARRVRHRTMHVVALLDACSVCLALLATVLAVVSLRRAMRELEDENRTSALRMTALEERSSELEQFAGRVAHDVMGPLSAPLLALETLRRRLPGDEAAQSLVARGLSGVARCRRLVDGLLEFARAGALSEEGDPASLQEVVDDVAGAARVEAAGAGVDLRVEALEPCALACSAGVLTSVLSNLLRNAIKHMGDASTREVIVASHARDGRCRVEVADTGPGVPVGLERAIFDPFVRGPTAAPGVGLGLATVARLVRAHGGEIGVRPRAGGGSVFWFEMPLAAGRPDAVLRARP